MSVPHGIGIDTVAGILAPLHTHDSSGIIHVESAVSRAYTLGDFFGVWGVRFTPTCVGGIGVGGDTHEEVYVNGSQVSGDPRAVRLLAHEEIAIVIGTQAQRPASIPSSYAFPAGL